MAAVAHCQRPSSATICTPVTRGSSHFGTRFGSYASEAPPSSQHATFAPARAPILRYGVALLSIILALIPAFLLSDVVESRLVVFAVAVMVSAWYGGWKPGLVATSFALTVSAYFSLAGAHTPGSNTQGHHTSGAVCIRGAADLLVQCCAALGTGRLAPLGDQFPLPGDQCALRHLPLRLPRHSSRRQSGAGEHAGLRSAAELVGRIWPTCMRDAQQWFTVADYFALPAAFKE